MYSITNHNILSVILTDIVYSYTCVFYKANDDDNDHDDIDDDGNNDNDAYIINYFNLFK